jgi:Sigma-70, region 4
MPRSAVGGADSVRRSFPRWDRAAGIDDVGTRAFDRLGSRAWTLVMGIVGNEEQAKAIVVAAFCPGIAVAAHGSDGTVLCQLRRDAIQAAAVAPEIGGQSSPVLGAIASLPAEQREVIELATIGRLSAIEIADAIGLPRTEVIRLIACGMRTLRLGLNGATEIAPPARSS